MIKYLAIPAILATSLTAFADNHGGSMENAEKAMDVAGNVAECIDGKDAEGNACQAAANSALEQVEGATEMKQEAENAIEAAKDLKDAASQ